MADRFNHLDISYDDKRWGNIIDPGEWNQNFHEIENWVNTFVDDVNGGILTEEDIEDLEEHFATHEYVETAIEEHNNVYKGTCEDGFSVTNRTVVCEGFVLKDKACIDVMFWSANDRGVTLNVNSTGAKPVRCAGNRSVQSYAWLHNQVVRFWYDEYYDAWLMLGVNTYVQSGHQPQVLAGNYSTAEGLNNVATGDVSHAEGSYTTASGDYSHSEGYSSKASGKYSHAEGYYTEANHRSQHVFGEYNVLDASANSSTTKGDYIEIVGNGTGNSARSNARTLDWNGNEILAGKLTVGVNPINNMDVTTKQYVDNVVSLVLPAPPQNDGSYRLKLLVNQGVPTYTWVQNISFNG